MTVQEKTKLAKRINQLKKKKERLLRKEASLTFPDLLIESEIEDIDEEIWELERSLEN